MSVIEQIHDMIQDAGGKLEEDVMDDGTKPTNVAGMFGAALDAHRYADALIAIVAQPRDGHPDRDVCPNCNAFMDWAGWNGELAISHSPDCPWLTAARALEIAD